MLIPMISIYCSIQQPESQAANLALDIRMHYLYKKPQEPGF